MVHRKQKFRRMKHVHQTANEMIMRHYVEIHQNSYLYSIIFLRKYNTEVFAVYFARAVNFCVMFLDEKALTFEANKMIPRRDHAY